MSFKTFLAGYDESNGTKVFFHYVNKRTVFSVMTLEKALHIGVQVNDRYFF